MGTGAADTVNVIFDGTRLTRLDGGTITSVETITANLGGGSDTLSYAGTAAAIGVTVNLAAPSAPGFNSISNIENVTGGEGADNLLGNNQVNALSGNGGNDTITGGVSNDSINGGAGDDTILYTIGDGVDTMIDGGADTDTFVVAAPAGNVNTTLGLIASGGVITRFNGAGATNIQNIEVITIDLAGGVDALSFNGSTDGVIASLSGAGSHGLTLLTGIENLQGGSRQRYADRRYRGQRARRQQRRRHADRHCRRCPRQHVR